MGAHAIKIADNCIQFTRGCHTYTYCRAICDRGQTQSQRSRSPKTIRSQVQQEITRSRDKTKTLTHNQIKRIFKGIRTYTRLYGTFRLVLCLRDV